MEIVEVIKIRIDSLQHNRQFIGFLAVVLTGIYTIIGIFLVNKGFNQNLLILGLLLTFALADLCFILSIFLLTDSIHNYSKILEYRQNDLFTNGESKASLAHQRALICDDLSYFFARVGTFFLIYNLLLAVITVITQFIKQIPFFIALAGLIILGILAFFLVIYCYRVSHYKIQGHSFSKSVIKFWDYRQWRKAIKSTANIEK